MDLHLNVAAMTRPCQVGRCNRHDATRRPTSVYACTRCWALVERLTIQHLAVNTGGGS